MADLLGSDDFQEDPAAEFLAREQDDLAEFGEDFGEEQPEANAMNGLHDGLGGMDHQPVVNGFADEEKMATSDDLSSDLRIRSLTERLLEDCNKNNAWVGKKRKNKVENIANVL
nr:uncharacterized protein LOC131772635 [Pocillopora verrucosa]